MLIAETDHVFMKEPRNLATRSKPVCFPFGYMNAKAAEPVAGFVAASRYSAAAGFSSWIRAGAPFSAAVCAE